MTKMFAEIKTKNQLGPLICVTFNSFFLTCSKKYRISIFSKNKGKTESEFESKLFLINARSVFRTRSNIYDRAFLQMYPTNTPRVFHVETTWRRLFPRRFNVKYTLRVCRVFSQKTSARLQLLP